MKNTNYGIVKTFNEYDFINEFKACNRENHFSYQGLRILFESLEQIAIDCGINIEMDVIALCCEYNEDDMQTIIDDHNIDVSDCIDNDDILETVESYLQDIAFICGQHEDDNGVTYFIYQAT